jgi:hypothetical protein
MRGISGQRPPASVYNGHWKALTSNADNIFLDATSVRGRQKRSHMEVFFMDNLEKLTEATAQQFFTGVKAELASVGASLVKAVSIFLVNRPSCLAAFIASGLISVMDFGSQELLESNIRILIACVSLGPHIRSVQLDMIKKILVHVGRPGPASRLLKFFSVFLPRYRQHPEGIVIIRTWLEGWSSYMTNEHFISMVWYVYKHVADLRNVCLEIFSAGWRSSVGNVAAACFRALCRTGPTQKDVEGFVEAMQSDNKAGQCLRVLARVAGLSPSRRLVAVVLTTEARNPLAIVSLCNLAANPRGAKPFLEVRTWLQPNVLSAPDAIMLFVTLCRHGDVRAAIGRDEKLPAFLAKIAAEGQPGELQAMATVVRTLALPPQFGAALDGCGFFENFCARSLGSQSVEAHEAAVLLVDTLARTGGWTLGYFYFIQYLPAVLGTSGTLQQSGFSALLVLAQMGEAFPYFGQVGLAGALAAYGVPPEYEGWKQEVIQVLSNYPPAA